MHMEAAHVKLPSVGRNRGGQQMTGGFETVQHGPGLEQETNRVC